MAGLTLRQIAIREGRHRLENRMGSELQLTRPQLTYQLRQAKYLLVSLTLQAAGHGEIAALLT